MSKLSNRVKAMTTTHCTFELFSEILDHEPLQYSISPEPTSESADADFLNMLQEYIATLPQVDSQKVERIKEKLLKGDLNIESDPQKMREQAQTIAEKMLKLEADLFGK